MALSDVLKFNLYDVRLCQLTQSGFACSEQVFDRCNVPRTYSFVLCKFHSSHLDEALSCSLRDDQFLKESLKSHEGVLQRAFCMSFEYILYTGQERKPVNQIVS